MVDLSPEGGGGGCYSLIWHIRVCAAEQGKVFRVLSLKYNFTTERLEQGVF